MGDSLIDKIFNVYMRENIVQNGRFNKLIKMVQAQVWVYVYTDSNIETGWSLRNLYAVYVYKI